VDAVVTRQPDHSFEIRWQGAAQKARIYAGPAPHKISRSTPVAMANHTDHAITPRLDHLPRPYFELHRDDQPPVMAAERILVLEGVANARDMGGYQTIHGRRTRWGRVYRTGSFAGATDADLEVLQNLGLRLVCDLRSDDEVEEDPNRLPQQPAPEYRHLPISAGSQTRERVRDVLFNPSHLTELMVEAYTKYMIADNGPIIGEMFRAMADPANLPIAIHCTAGKDRTGITIAVLLAALGVPDEVIIADYSLSNRYFADFRAFMKSKFKPVQAFILGINVDDIQPLLTAPPQNLQITLNYIREHYGSVEQYLAEQADVNADTLAALKANLLE
jgi:protein-tyrosine phosphatase